VRYVRFDHDDRSRVGAVIGDDEVAVLGVGDSLLGALGHDLDGTPRLALGEVRLLAPIARPPKLFCVGPNYPDRIEECGLEKPSHLFVVNQQSTCVDGPFDPIHVPRASSTVDYEGTR
jgi:2-keto-4-pentenoate hydratase/2-oxohepta-3-ene-1,7-dioic acid hydratase in catechol pathway